MRLVRIIVFEEVRYIRFSHRSFYPTSLL
jgi:hypothetical protein